MRVESQGELAGRSERHVSLVGGKGTAGEYVSLFCPLLSQLG